MRQMPKYVLPQGVIDLDLETNRLTAYITGYNPIPFAQIETKTSDNSTNEKKI